MEVFEGVWGVCEYFCLCVCGVLCIWLCVCLLCVFCVCVCVFVCNVSVLWLVCVFDVCVIYMWVVKCMRGVCGCFVFIL